MGREALPQRSTRGKRLKAAVDEEEEQADAQFWNQEFFKEEAVDDDYKTESESEDEVDSDFDQKEDDDDDEEVEVRDEPRKKALKPPGYKAKPKPKPKPKPKVKVEEDDDYAEEEEEEEEAEGEEAEAAAAPKARKPPPEPKVYVAPTLRRSTVARVADSTRERQYKEKSTPRRRGPGSSNSNWRPLTQQELLAEAALNEIENTRSLKALLAQEEETKRKAQVVKKKNTGPSIKFRTKRGADGEEHTTLELVNTYVPPPRMQPSHAPPPPDKPTCFITALPARYTDPATRTPFANTLAFKRLRTGAGPLAPSLQQQLVLHHHMEELQQQQRGGQQGAGQHGQQQLLEQLRAQRQRMEQLAERARAVAEAARTEPAVPEMLPPGATVDVMALLVDVQRTLQAAA
ncbi:hypothetical protein Agub_g10963 [Astrephomene gubernaculifera]|uniref:Vps72/YL1 C-terminal domain-containing protein n=1 Tax=Astrephomene gubernaculifera TaxID=47775 RepID=A0AAD3HPE6_9CHLO|nr:hypothetical protein Agub_g10963 [Astrephomene gubernaculifera]